MFRRAVALIVVSSVALSLGCWGGGPKPTGKVPTFPVKGKVHIDGAPTLGVTLYFFGKEKAYDKQISLTEYASQHFAVTDAEGNFKATTYEHGDGLPVGEYSVAVYWAGKNPPPVKVYGPVDDEPVIDRSAIPFNKKYGNPVKSGIKVTVEAGKTKDLGTLDLTTK